MKIGGLQKLTLLDFPGCLSAIVFTKGCNFNCPYCQNSSLINLDNNEIMSEEDILTFLQTRIGKLDGVVITGGEPTIHKDLEEFIKKIKELGYKIKLDTNGSNPIMLLNLIKNKLVDYVAMDVKNNFDSYNTTVDKNIKLDNIKKSIKILQDSKINHEFRITIVKDYHNINKIIDIVKYIGNKDKIYIQNYEYSESVRNKELKSFTKEELIVIQELLSKEFSNVIVRNL